MDFTTRCIHTEGLRGRYDNTGAVSVPIFQSATFAHPGVGRSTGFDYSRAQNPTREHLEEVVTGLEGGTDSLAFASGMAALTCLMELFSPGDELIASDDLYGGSHRLFRHVNEKNGIRVKLTDTSDPAAVERLFTPQTKAVLIETPTNPMMKVTDIRAVADITRRHGALLIVDNTFLSPFLQRPLELGADVVLHSGTKYLAGHNDTLAGFLTVKDTSLAERLRFMLKTVGSMLAPFDCWLVIRGIKTLAVRMERQEQNAARIAAWLDGHPAVETVYYTGLPAHPGHEIAKAQASGFGAMVSFRVRSEAAAVRLLESVRVIQYAESLGGVESLVTYPLLQTHADMTKEERDALGINECLLRLSVGLESADDLIADLEQALKGDDQ